MATVAKYFSGTQPVKNLFYMGNRDFHDKFPGVVGVRVDGFSKFVGHPESGPDKALPVTRVIFYSTQPSKHKCDARCQGARGRNCECSCGGAFHGVNS